MLKLKLTKKCEKTDGILNFLWNHDEMTDFSEILGEFVYDENSAEAGAKDDSILNFVF